MGNARDGMVYKAMGRLGEGGNRAAQRDLGNGVVRMDGNEVAFGRERMDVKIN